MLVFNTNPQMALNITVAITDTGAGTCLVGKEQGPPQLSPQQGWDESLNPSRPGAACAGSHKYLPLKEAALSLATTTSWAVKREREREKKRRKRGKKERQPPKRTPLGISHQLWEASTHSSSRAMRSLGAFPALFPVVCPISQFFAHFSAGTWCFPPRAALQHPWEWHSDKQGGHSSGTTAPGRADFKGWG